MTVTNNNGNVMPTMAERRKRERIVIEYDEPTLDKELKIAAAVHDMTRGQYMLMAIYHSTQLTALKKAIKQELGSSFEILEIKFDRK